MPVAGTLIKKAKQQNISVAELVQAALTECGGNEFKAAVKLGVYPGTIRYWRLGKNVQTSQTPQS